MLNDNDLLPEEQRNPGLIQELRATHRLKPEEQQALARVHTRLAHSSRPIPPIPVIPQLSQIEAVRVENLLRSQQRITSTERPAGTARFRRRWLTRLNALAAAILIVILVGSLALTLSLTHRTTTGSPGNGIHLLLEPVKGSDPSQAEMQLASDILLRRFSSFGLSGASASVITIIGHLAIQVDLPHFGGNELQTAATLVQAGNLEFWCTGPYPLQLNTTFDPSRYTQFNLGGRPRFTGADLDPNSIYVSYDQAGHPQIDFEMQGSFIGAFGTFTANNIGEYLTITFDRNVIESAVIQNAINGPAVIDGTFAQQQANAIVADLKAGALPVALTIAR